MKTTKFDFSYNFSSSVKIRDLEKLGWDFSTVYEDVAKAIDISYREAEVWENENYHAVISVDREGGTFCFTQSNDGQLFSNRENTGDDLQTVEDLEQLDREGRLWNKKQLQTQ